MLLRYIHRQMVEGGITHSELCTTSVVRSLWPRLQTDVPTKLPLLLSTSATVRSHLSDGSQMGHGLKGVTAVGLAEDVPQ